MALFFVEQDITTMQVDAIVNAANTALLQGGGVCGSIFKAAGSAELSAACAQLGHCATGQAVITKGFHLPAKYIIHTPGPVWQGGNAQEEQLLTNCYLNSLQLALQYNCSSIAFPLISSGIYGYPKEEALRIAIAAIRSFLEKQDLTVYLIIFGKFSLVLAKELDAPLRIFLQENKRYQRRRGPIPDYFIEHNYWRARKYLTPVEEQILKQNRPPDTSEEEGPLKQGHRETASADAERLQEQHLQSASANVKMLQQERLQSDLKNAKMLRQKCMLDIAEPAPGQASFQAPDEDNIADLLSSEHIAYSIRMDEKEPPLDLPCAGKRKHIEALPSLKQETPEASFAETVLKIINTKGWSDVDVYKRANLDRKLFSKLRRHKDHTPSRTTAISLAVGLQLNVEEANALLEKAGYILSNASKTDLIVKYFLYSQCYDIITINETLLNYGEKPFGPA